MKQADQNYQYSMRFDSMVERFIYFFLPYYTYYIIVVYKVILYKDRGLIQINLQYVSSETSITYRYCYPNINLRGGVIQVEANFFDLNAELKTIFNQ